MSEKIDEVRKKYWEYLDLNRGRHSLADLGVRNPQAIELNVFAEIIIKTLIRIKNYKEIAHITLDELFVESIFLNDTHHTKINLREIGIYSEIPNKNNFDLIFSTFPFGFRIRPDEDPDGHFKNYSFKNQNISVRVSYEIIRSLESMQLLSKNGIGICFLPSYFQPFEISKFRDILEDNNLYIEAIINLPQDLLKGVMALKPIFVLVGRSKKEKEFILDLDSIDAIQKGLDAYINPTKSKNINEGIWLTKDEFSGFDAWKYNQEINSLKGDLSTYSRVRIGDISNEINVIGTSKTFKDLPDSVYLPLIGNKNAVTRKDELLIKDQNCAQIVVNRDKVLPEYLASFLNSKIGKKYIEFKKADKGGVIPKLNSQTVSDMEVGVPDIDQQKEIATNLKKINELKTKIEEYGNNLSINPASDHKTLKKVDSLIEIVNELTDADSVRSIIRRGEDVCTEFKQTFSLDVAKQTKEKYIIDSALKTICAFFNTKGGDLVIGVDDEKNITGIENELEKFHKGDPDKFLNNFKDLFKRQIGPEFYPFMDQKILEVNEKKVFLVSCKPSDKEVFMDKIDFYVRTTPATDKLEGPSQINYIRTRFGG